MEVEAFRKPHSSSVDVAIESKELSYFNRLYYMMHLKSNTTLDSDTMKEQKRMLLGSSGSGFSLPSPQKKRSVSETNQSSSNSSHHVNTPPTKKKKGNDEEKKITKVKVYTSTLFEKGLLISGDQVLFKHEDKEIPCKVNNHGELEVENADKSDKRTSNNLRILMQFIVDAYKLSTVGKSKYWTLFYLVKKKVGLIKLKTLRERYLALLEEENQPQKSTPQKSDKPKKRRKRRNTEDKKKKVFISHLVQFGLLKDGDKVVYRGQKNTFFGKIEDSKYITYFDQDTKKEEQFETPNSFKSHIRELGNCWQQMFLRKGQEEIPFQTLRDEYFN